VSPLPADSGLTTAAATVCAAIRYHATTCEQEADNPEAVIAAGKALADAVLEYETVLRAASGWSSPIRHLGPLPLFREDTSSHDRDGGDARSHRAQLTPTPTRARITATYLLRIDDDDDLVAFVSGRFGDDLSEVREAINTLYKAESWDPHRYPPGLLNVERVTVTTSLENAP
jgi:hypothetical protein